MNDDYIRVCVSLRQEDINKLEQIIKWRDGKISGDRSATIRKAISGEYLRMAKLHESLITSEDLLYANPYEASPES